MKYISSYGLMLFCSLKIMFGDIICFTFYKNLDPDSGPVFGIQIRFQKAIKNRIQ